MIAVSRAMLSNILSRWVSGCCLMSPCNLAKAINEPENVKMPMTAPPAMSKPEFWLSVAQTATRKAANPPKPLKAAIVCGRAVILM